MSKPVPNPEIPGDPPGVVLKAVRRLLRPLVKMLISFQVTFPVLADMLKSIYVEVAENEFPIEGKKQTDTRISLLTGVHRKDTRRLRQTIDRSDDAPKTVSVGAQMVGLWVSGKEYLDAEGKPKPLPLKTKDDSVSFETLVQTVCKQDMRSRVVLDEWLRLGVASVNGNDEIELNVSAFVPQQGLEEKAFYLGMNIADHIASVDNNLKQGNDPLLERCVYYGGLSDVSVKKLQTAAEEKGMEALMEINSMARALREEDKSIDGDSCHRINFGVYFFHEPISKKTGED